MSFITHQVADKKSHSSPSRDPRKLSIKVTMHYSSNTLNRNTRSITHTYQRYHPYDIAGFIQHQQQNIKLYRRLRIRTSSTFSHSIENFTCIVVLEMKGNLRSRMMYRWQNRTGLTWRYPEKQQT